MYYLEQVRQLMLAVFTPESLAIFCYDRLLPFYATLPAELPWPEAIERLLDYAHKHQQISLLLTWLAERDPQAHTRYEPYDALTALERHPMRQRYLDYLKQTHQYLELSGFAPRVSGREVKLPLAKTFLPLQSVEGRPALSEYAEQDLQRGGHELAQQEVDKRYVHLQARYASQRPLTLAELLSHRRAVLLGDPGTGKTTVTRYVTYALATQDSTHIGTNSLGLIPILVRIANYAQAFDKGQVDHVSDYIQHYLTPRSEFGEFLLEVMQQGQAWLILDGLDEVTNPALRMQITERIQLLVASYPANSFLVTSRIVGYDLSPLTRDFQHATLKTMELADQERFVRLWYTAIETESSSNHVPPDELLEALRQRPSISRLAATPLLLTIMVLMHWRGTKLPHRRVQVYESATDTLIEYWTLHRRIELDALEVKTILAPIAHAILSQNVGGVIAKTNLWPLVCHAVHELRGGSQAETHRYAKQLLHDLGEHSGLFLERGVDNQGQSVYGFLHLTFGEYLAGVHLVNEFNNGQTDLSRYLHRAIWREPLLLAMGHIAPMGRTLADKFLQAILTGETLYEEILQRNLLLAVDCLIDEVQVSPSLRDEILTHLAELLKSEYSTLQEEAIKRYKELGKGRYGEAALTALKTVYAQDIAQPDEVFSIGNNDERLMLAQVLLYLGDNFAAKPLLWPLTEGNKLDGRTQQAQWLRFEYWPREAADYLLELYQQHGISTWETLSNCHLGRIYLDLAQRVLGQANLQQILIRLLSQTTNATTQAELQYFLAFLTESDSLEAWQELTQADKPAKIRRYAASHLLDTPHHNQAVTVLQILVQHEPSQATEAMQTLLKAKVTPTLDWTLLQTLAFLPQGNVSAIKILLQVGQLDLALPAMWHYMATYSFGSALAFIQTFPPAQTHLAQAIAHWLVLQRDFSAGEWLLELGQVDETLPSLNDLAIHTLNDDTRQQVCRKLLALLDTSVAAPLMVHLTASTNSRLRYDTYLTLALADCRLADITPIGLNQLRQETYPAYQQRYCHAWQHMLALARQSLADLPESPSRLLGEMSLDLLAQGYSQGDARELLYRRDNPALQLQGAWFCLRTGDVGQLQPRLLKWLHQYATTTANDLTQTLQRWTGYLLLHTPATPALGQEVLTWLTSENQSLRQWAYQVWPKLRQKLELPQITELLLAALQDKNWEIRSFVARALGQQGDVTAIPALIQALENEFISYFARQALQKLYQWVDQATLIQAASHEKWQVRQAAVETLAQQPDGSYWLEQALNDSHEEVQAAALKGYVTLGFKQKPDAPTLTKLTDLVTTALDEAKPVAIRSTAIELLVYFEESLARAYLLPALDHETWQIRDSAVTAFTHFATPADLPVVLARLADTDYDVRRGATQLLGQLAAILSAEQRHEVESALLQIGLYSDNTYSHRLVRQEAWRVLAKMGYEPDPDMLTMLRHSQGVKAIAPFLATGKIPHAKEILLAHAMLGPNSLTIDEDIVVALKALGVALPWAWLVDEAEE